MNLHTPAPVSIGSLIRSLCLHRELIVEMTKREVIGRYKGSVMGLLWSFANPLLLLTTYTFVFSVVFKARWGDNAIDSRTSFAVLVFVGMIVHSLFSETLVRAPSLILANVAYVKKIVFPLEILPVVAMGTSLFHSAASLLVLVLALAFLNASLTWTVFLLPFVLFPIVLLSLGLAWGLASLGVFLRDVAHPISLAMTVLLFASPVFYPISALPQPVQPWLMLNPLTFIIEQAREVLIFGRTPDWSGLGIYSVAALLIAWGGYVWFQKTRKGFANVL